MVRGWTSRRHLYRFLRSRLLWFDTLALFRFSLFPRPKGKRTYDSHDCSSSYTSRQIFEWNYEFRHLEPLRLIHEWWISEVSITFMHWTTTAVVYLCQGLYLSISYTSCFLDKCFSSEIDRIWESWKSRIYQTFNMLVVELAYLKILLNHICIVTG